MNRKKKTMDGNSAAAHVSYAFHPLIHHGGGDGRHGRSRG